MAKAPQAVETKGMDDWKRRVSFDFGKGGMPAPEGFTDLSVKQEVTVLVTGTVTNIHHSVDSSSFTLTMTKLKLQTQPKDPLEAAFAGHRMKVK